MTRKTPNINFVDSNFACKIDFAQGIGAVACYSGSTKELCLDSSIITKHLVSDYRSNRVFASIGYSTRNRKAS